MRLFTELQFCPTSSKTQAVRFGSFILFLQECIEMVVASTYNYIVISL